MFIFLKYGTNYKQLFESQFSSVAQSCPSLRPHGLQYARFPYPSLTPGAYSNSCPLSRWCHPTISSSVVPFFSRLRFFPASGSFPMSWLSFSTQLLFYSIPFLLHIFRRGWHLATLILSRPGRRGKGKKMLSFLFPLLCTEDSVVAPSCTSSFLSLPSSAQSLLRKMFLLASSPAHGICHLVLKRDAHLGVWFGDRWKASSRSFKQEECWFAGYGGALSGHRPPLRMNPLAAAVRSSAGQLQKPDALPPPSPAPTPDNRSAH